MTLAEFQQTVKKLWTTPEGSQALASKKALKAFVSQTALSPQEKDDLMAQPIARLRQYDFMLLANTDDTLQSIYPYTYQLLEDDWDEVVTHYFWQHPNTAYDLMETARTFPDFLLAEETITETLPFLPELACYEWVEAELLSAPNQNYPQNLLPEIPRNLAELNKLAPVLNSISTLLQFRYPVPAIIDSLQADNQTEFNPSRVNPQTTLLWVYRNNNPYVCRFFELNAVLATWLNLVTSASEANSLHSYQETISPVFSELHKMNPEIEEAFFNDQFLSTLNQLYEKGILIGSVPVIER